MLTLRVMNFVRRKGITLEDLIFKPNYTIQVDGDEYCEFADMFKFGMINLDNLEDISSGVDYWADNIQTFYPEHILDKPYFVGDDDRSYAELFDTWLKENNRKVIEIDSFGELTEEQAKTASEYLQKYRNTHKFIFGTFHNTELKEKYFSWVVSNE